MDRKGIEYEAGPGHGEIIIRDPGPKGAKHVVAPGTKGGGHTKPDVDEPLDPIKAPEHRAMTARLNYTASGRPGLAFSVKELARTMGAPTVACRKELKLLARHLLNRLRMVLKSKHQKAQEKLRVCTDADWAGCRSTRESASGGAVALGSHALKAWSKTQSLLALSPGEGGFYAALGASAEALGVLPMVKGFGCKMKGGPRRRISSAWHYSAPRLRKNEAYRHWVVVDTAGSGRAETLIQ